MITGASLVPVMVTETVWSTVPPWPSVNTDREGLELAVADRQILDGRSRHRVGPGHHAAGAGVGGVGGDDGRQGAQRAPEPDRCQSPTRCARRSDRRR